jgi:hypothetical protein
MTTADMLSVLTTAPLEYSYFDHGKLGVRAGPKHWKHWNFKPMSKVVAKGRKKKEVGQLDLDLYDGKEDKDELQELLMKVEPKVEPNVDSTVKESVRKLNPMTCAHKSRH